MTRPLYPPYTPRVTPADIIRTLGLRPHPEGGHYVETWRQDGADARGAGTAICFLLQAGERSHWHRIDAAEVWHFYAGAALELETWIEGETTRRRILGLDLGSGQRPQLIVEPDEWQAARSLGDWTLVGCTVSPAFEFDRFELAPEGWHP